MRIRVLTTLLLLAALVVSAGALAPAASAKRKHHHHRRHHHRTSVTTPATPSTPVGTCTNADARPVADNLAAVQVATLCLINQERTTRRLVALQTNDHLDQAALGHSLDMVRNNYFDHVAPDGSTFIDRILKSGYADPKAAWTLGENIAWGTGTAATPTRIVDSWMHSPGHRENILRPEFRDSGIGIAAGVPASQARGHAGATYTQDFGAK